MFLIKKSHFEITLSKTKWQSNYILIPRKNTISLKSFRIEILKYSIVDKRVFMHGVKTWLKLVFGVQHDLKEAKKGKQKLFWGLVRLCFSC